MCRMFSEQNDGNENHLLRRRLACTAYTSCTPTSGQANGDGSRIGVAPFSGFLKISRSSSLAEVCRSVERSEGHR